MKRNFTDDVGRGCARLHARAAQQIQVEALLQEAPTSWLPAGPNGPGRRRPRESSALAAAQLPQSGYAFAPRDLRVAARRGRALAYQEQLDARQRRRTPTDRSLLPESQWWRRRQRAPQSRAGKNRVVFFFFFFFFL